jgi:hypothetical protein
MNLISIWRCFSLILIVHAFFLITEYWQSKQWQVFYDLFIFTKHILPVGAPKTVILQKKTNIANLAK